MKQLEEQKKRRLEEPEAANSTSPNTVAKHEKDEMRRILDEEQPRASDSEEYFGNIPTETEQDSSPERVPRRRRHHHHHQPRHHHDAGKSDKTDIPDYETHAKHGQYTSRTHEDSATSETNGDLVSLVNEDSSKVLLWLRGYGGGGSEKRILLSEDRLISLLQAFKEGSYLQKPEINWVPLEKLREAERRSSAAEEQIRYFEQLFNAGEGSESGGEEEQLRTVLTKSKTMDRHFAHMKKFAEDRHADLKRMYSNLSDRDVKIWRANSLSRVGMVSPEKAKKDLQEHENHKKRLVQVFTNYNELLRLVKVEHARRLEAENKTYQLASQLKRQTATLKRAEKVIKHTALSPVMFNNEAHLFNSRPAPHYNANFEDTIQAPSSPSHLNSSGRHSPFASSPSTPRQVGQAKSFDANMEKASNSRSNSPVPASHKHQTISKHLSYDLALDPPTSRDVSPSDPQVASSDAISDNHSKEFHEIENALIQEGRSKGFGDVDLYTEKKTVGKEETSWEYRHVHFDFNKAQNAAKPATFDLQCVSSLPDASRRTPCPDRSEGSSFTADEKRDLHDPNLLNESQARESPDIDNDRHLFGSAESIASYQEGQDKLNKQHGPMQVDSHLLISPRSPLKLAVPIASLPGLELAEKNASPRSPVKLAPSQLDPEVLSIPEIKMAEERTRLEALDNPHKSAGVPRADVAASNKQQGTDDQRRNVASSDDVAERRPNEHRSDVSTTDDVAASKAPNVAGHVDSARSPDKKPKGVQPAKSTFDLQRRVAAIEAGNVARTLHGQVKQRRRLLLIQVVLFGAACLWGLSPISWQSSLPPT
ncbi:hypothetical protein L7F22_002029 [Adiantum nelumboides]|nr:hypothetical protein [Adiantum nelumboides]